jgi:hypothetical protein
MPDSRWETTRAVFKDEPTDPEKKAAFRQKREQFGPALQAELRKLARAYDKPVLNEPHIQTIRGLTERLSKDFAEVLNEDILVFGIAQKALNVYLKYLWCADSSKTKPPHCPFDYDIISTLKLKPGTEHRWTYCDSEDDYREWVKAAWDVANKKSYSSLAEWEVEEWATIQAKKAARERRKRESSGMFYIYENWQAGPRKAVIHKGSCGNCNDGKGRTGSYDPRHAKWHGPYEDLESAREASEAMSQVVEHKECRCSR